jgi:hypothetical protein
MDDEQHTLPFIVHWIVKLVGVDLLVVGESCRLYCDNFPCQIHLFCFSIFGYLEKGLEAVAGFEDEAALFA